MLYVAGMALRSKIGKLRIMYNTIDQAEAALGLSVDGYIMSAQLPAPSSTSSPQLPAPSSSASAQFQAYGDMSSGELGTLLLSLFEQFLKTATKDEAASLLDSMTSSLLNSCGFCDPEAAVVVSSALQSMSTLSHAGKNPYLVGKFATCIIKKRPSGDDSLMPLHRMPFALIEYQVQFFTAAHVSKVLSNMILLMPDGRVTNFKV
jgi:hypothetical protein